ncbi:glutamine--fructose-6-phosphate transaminase (isomerizing) [Pseudonocardia sp. KRD291]|uniref:glutamine--fructose-6-phosphate transaminase (isomerizing) n=1 Tax=Pseudonocardia sp. KRD291 TaxID=2792007 RepID=UPI001C4A0AC5|nr:glutamine--fructose-6-phosphate transaminase (isomerizing) [Pseudonocardia sp. KRD291]MBW0101541.1 glutamine--fructose-6-phosphate transaminase (isomerizing) [Pseudonocardia sp. KRD291]
MCGIVAYRGLRPALPALLQGLSRLEYRGYDSTGVALNPGDGHPVEVYRAAGRLPELAAVLPAAGQVSCTGIAHTRWATHGAPTVANAHPHVDCTGTVAVVHNGTLDDAAELAAELTAAGHLLSSDVDTELVAHLVESHLSPITTGAGPTAAAVVAAVGAATARLRGSWALAVTVRGLDAVVLARHRSPLLVGEGDDFTMASSDQLGFATEVHTVRELAEGDIVVLGDRHGWFDHTGRAVTTPRPGRPAEPPAAPADRGGADDFTAKEIDDQPAAAEHLIATVAGRLARGALLHDLGLPTGERIRLVACGSSAYAARVTARVLATVAGIPATVVIASEATADAAEPDTLTIAFSQSGETADVLAALDHWHDPLLAVTNNPQSTLARRSDAVLGLGCGPEFGVAATKSFTNQVLAGSALALSLASALGRLSVGELVGFEDQLAQVPARMAATHRLSAGPARDLARRLAMHPAFIYTSRGAGVPYAFEGALKLKELAYRWVEALPAGELKHGPLALIQAGTPVILVQARPLDRLAVNGREMAARGARLIIIGPGEDADVPVAAADHEPPWGPLESVIALQHFARETTRHLGHDVDRPRNLAKSVTVE